MEKSTDALLEYFVAEENAMGIALVIASEYLPPEHQDPSHSSCLAYAYFLVRRLPKSIGRSLDFFADNIFVMCDSQINKEMVSNFVKDMAKYENIFDPPTSWQDDDSLKLDVYTDAFCFRIAKTMQDVAYVSLDLAEEANKTLETLTNLFGIEYTKEFFSVEEIKDAISEVEILVYVKKE